MNAPGTAEIFRLPDLGEGLAEAEILEWKVAVGDVVAVDQAVVEVETAKAAVEVPIPFAGTVVRLYGKAGSVLDVGEPLVAVSVPDEAYREQERAGSGNVLVGYGTGPSRRSRRRAARSARTARTAEPGARVRPEETPPAPAAPPRNAPVRARDMTRDMTRDVTGAPAVPRVISPMVRRLARAHGIDVAALTPSGPHGIVLRRDVDAAIASGAEAPDPAHHEQAEPAEPGVKAGLFGPAAPVAGTGPAGIGDEPVRVPLQGLRRTVAEKLTRSRREIPDATTWVDVDATPLVELKADLARQAPDARVGMLALLARICVAGLHRFPELNSYVDTGRQEIVQVPRVHLGFAAQTPRGLVVPVVHDADRLTLAELAARLRDLTEDAREGGLTPRRLTGGTFTLNNYGVFGVDGSTPIINHPEAAMLGVGRIADRPWGFEGEVRLRKVAQLSFTFDHRVCDGGVAGGFLRFVADCVERPEVLITNL